jgi:hypothetical protein
MRIVCGISIFALFVACSSGTNEPRTTRTEATETAQGEDAPHAPIDPSTACGHALACCRAYAHAMPDVVERSACAGIYDALDQPEPDQHCRMMTAGWRDALVHLNGSAPADCPE